MNIRSPKRPAIIDAQVQLVGLGNDLARVWELTATCHRLRGLYGRRSYGDGTGAGHAPLTHVVPAQAGTHADLAEPAFYGFPPARE